MESDEKVISVKPKKKRPLWVTTTMAAGFGREELLAATFKEIILHLISLVFLTIFPPVDSISIRHRITFKDKMIRHWFFQKYKLAFNSRPILQKKVLCSERWKDIFSQANNSEFYLTESIKKAFKVEDELSEATTAEKFWEYLNNKMLEEFYGSEKVKDLRKDEVAGESPKVESETEKKEGDKERLVDPTSEADSLVIANENFVLGVPRIRQVKVSEHSCDIHGYFRRLFRQCFSHFGSSGEERRTFGLGQPTAWVFSDASKTKSIRYWGTLTSYSGGGFYQDFSPNLKKTMAILDTLQNNLWVTRGTRAVFVDFSIYNANLNLYCICKIIFEFLPPGGVSPGFQFTPATLTPFGNVWDWILRILLYCFCAYIIYCFCEEIREMIHFRGTYFMQFWNYVDLIIIMLTCLLVVGSEYMRVVMEPYIEEILHNPTRYGNLETPGIIYQVVKTSGAVLLFFVYLRTFKYLNFSRRMAQLNNTIRNCSKDILGFSVMFFVAYFAYAELGYLVFGSQTDEFRSFGQSMFTLLRTILGDFDYEKIRSANWIVAPVYFLTYIILVFFVLLNMFLAIINDTYADVKIDIAIAPKEIEMSEYIRKKCQHLLKKLGCTVKQEAEKPMLINSNINHIRDALIKCDFDDREIEMYFKRYDIDPLKDLNKQDIEKFYEMFAQEDLARKRGEENIVTWKDFQRQDDKLVELENTLVMVGQKVQDLLRLIESVQDTHPKPLQL